MISDAEVNAYHRDGFIVVPYLLPPARLSELRRAFQAVIKSPAVVEVLTQLLGPDVRLHSSKLNMKEARYGSPVEWHQDWAFYPHTNDDVLAIGVMLDDTDLDNGPLLVTPGSHKGPVWNHHGADGRFCGL